MQRIYGWERQRVDERDFIITSPKKYDYPKSYEIDTSKTEIYDQLEIGSCTAISAARVYRHLTGFDGSPLFLYYNERKEDGTINEDAGSTIRQSVKSLNKTGICNEVLYPYNISKFKVMPTINCYKDGLLHCIEQYERVNQTKNDICQTLFNGNPVLFGFDVYESFEGSIIEKTGLMPKPKKNEKLVGGHAVHIIGYNCHTKFFTCVNSWGKNWGHEGLFYMPFSVALSSMCDDFWIIKIK